MKIESNKVLVQIGTNDGADEFNGLCQYSSPSKVILIEPITIFNESILKNYQNIKNVFIENVAITDVERGEVTLVIPKNRKDVWHTGNYTLLPMNDWGNDFEEHKSPSMTFMQLCKKYELTNIHYLQIDTEGFDYEIIKSIDFNKVNIDIIKYEKFGFPIEVYSRHGEKGKQYGITGLNFVTDLLTKLGYILQEEVSDIVAIKN